MYVCTTYAYVHTYLYVRIHLRMFLLCVMYIRTYAYIPAGVVLLDSTSSVEKFELSANELLTADPGAGSMQPFFGMPLVAMALGEEYTKSGSPELQRVMKITNK